MKYHKIEGETFFEATIKAESQFGKGNFTVVTSQKIKKSIYCGFGHKEMVELTIGVNLDPQRATGISTEAPTRPSPSIEVNLNRMGEIPHNYASYVNEPPISQQPKSIPIPPPPLRQERSIPQSVGLKAYGAQGSARPSSNMRAVHGLRTNQEGSSSPKSQRISNEGIETVEIESFLEDLIKIKDKRTRHDKILNASKSSKQKGPIDSFTEQKFQSLENQLKEVFSMVKELNHTSERVINKPVPELPEGIIRIKEKLLSLETPTEIANQIIGSIQEQLPLNALKYGEEACRATSDWLQERLRFSPEISFPKQGPKIIMLIGPTGVGKTTTIAKIAATYGLVKRKSIALFTLDTYRIGAADQLGNYAQIIDAEMEVLYKPDEVPSALKRHADKDLIIIDTAGRCQKNVSELDELGAFMERFPKPERFLVLSATSKFTDMMDVVNRFGKLCFEHLIFSKVDETNTVGPLLAVLYKTGKSLAFVTNGQAVPNDISPADFNFFGSHLLPS